MTRSPLAYPLSRGIDGDSGGAADLQTDIMRFMAILSLCLVAIFALVQSIPLAAELPAEPATEVAEPEPVVADKVIATVVEPTALPDDKPVTTVTRPTPAKVVAAEPVVLERPKREPQYQPPAVAAPAQQEPPQPTNNKQGFTLRFESDLALTRLVAAGHVGFYAIAAGRAQRMAVSDSRISFWDASTPNSFHEMEATTVPRPVVDALRRTGADTAAVGWGVTLPGGLRERLNTLMHEHSGGALVISADGNLNLEAS